MYWRATWFGIALMLFGIMTGEASLMFYSNTILSRMSTSGGGLSPKAGTYLIGITNFTSSALAAFVV